jgi:peptide/nickel transport system ATP-binding protein
MNRCGGERGEEVLALRGLSAGYTGSTDLAVDDLSLTLRAGAVHGLVGESGSGKSTAALLTVGYRSPRVVVHGGASVLGDVDLLATPVRRLRAIWGRDVAFIEQNAGLALSPVHRVGVQIDHSLRRHTQLSGRRRADRVQELLSAAQLDGPGFSRAYPHQLSGGQQQRAALALALAGEPRVLVLDEPTTGLDASTQREIIALLRRLTEERQIAGLFISHDLGLINRVAEQVTVLRRGRTIETGDVEHVLGQPAARYTRQLLEAIPRLTAAKAESPPATPGAASTVVPVANTARLEVETLVLRYPGRHEPALHEVSFQAGASELLGIVGESGSGKSSLLRALAGVQPWQAGRVTLEGNDLPITTRGRTRDQMTAIQLVFQNPRSSLNPRHTVRDALVRPVRLRAGRQEPRAEERSLRAALDAVELSAQVLDRLPHELSGGQQQRVGIARALAAGPRLLLCDEVTSALDVSTQSVIVDLIRSIANREAMTVIMVSHDLALLSTIATRLVVLRGGRVVEEGVTSDLVTAARHDYTRSLIGAARDLEHAPRPRQDDGQVQRRLVRD